MAIEPEAPQAVVNDFMAMIVEMNPVLDRMTYVFCSIDPAQLTSDIVLSSLALFHEEEGLSLILPSAKARLLKLPSGGAPMSRITLTVFSALEGVGLTAAVATALAEHGIACNMVAAYHHDHVFVPADQAQEAMVILGALQAAAAEENAR
ncbi:ACT domain-containing protein [Xinfangfangia sp. CPCC 101601]|uniref:ACT domain-containing protein n=1 Tax=Pseudogemmobacter lacusdianii TaxID=3069608 RepID=A0ABU0W1J0_9RHOB|nr:ACT domain-containing protein [Xinfangfangia sp. CPCC 101601]MDQ2067887.1 ACT domain-containing protein [Xinfangfangia sp. CPCC 101601]